MQLFVPRPKMSERCGCFCPQSLFDRKKKQPFSDCYESNVDLHKTESDIAGVDADRNNEQVLDSKKKRTWSFLSKLSISVHDQGILDALRNQKNKTMTILESSDLMRRNFGYLKNIS